ncbi:hypothetical protein [Mesorhizobium onobrychidis]|uniref:Uncharacterized protein n=1 Tax=Mesorhizobium onobrychidis TaxID=2775404 RepID=A0ABY5QYD1_9HYPH|nr:hypothetical protein [Mesorhizobium onobrychidis]UVC15467.1 hypothetical protein IHQ72_34360 [Mesorhizobium onobrychidis]
MHQASPPAFFVLAPHQGLTGAQNRDPLFILWQAVCRLLKSSVPPPQAHHDYLYQPLKRFDERLPRASKSNHAATRVANKLVLVLANGGSDPDAI